MKKMKSILMLSLGLVVCASTAFAQVGLDTGGTSYSDAPASEQSGSLLGETQLAPLAGFTAINSTTGFNVGLIGGYRPWLDVPLSIEPSLILGFFDKVTLFNFDAGLRYDLAIPGSRVKPFIRAALGPTFQTEGDSPVFNAQLAIGAILPAVEGMDFRAQAALVNIDGNAGFQLLAGIAL